MLHYVHMGFGSVFEQEVHVKIEKGAYRDGDVASFARLFATTLSGLFPGLGDVVDQADILLTTRTSLARTTADQLLRSASSTSRRGRNMATGIGRDSECPSTTSRGKKPKRR